MSVTLDSLRYEFSVQTKPFLAENDKLLAAIFFFNFFYSNSPHYKD